MKSYQFDAQLSRHIAYESLQWIHCNFDQRGRDWCHIKEISIRGRHYIEVRGRELYHKEDINRCALCAIKCVQTIIIEPLSLISKKIPVTKERLWQPLRLLM